MTRLRAILSVFGLAGLALVLVVAYLDIPRAGHYRGPYGDVVAPAAVDARHVTDAVTAVNFDFRGLDTLGEEFILFVSVLGVVALLRQSEESAEGQGEEEDCAPGRAPPKTSDSVRTFGGAMVGPTALLGLYIVAHGQLTPGGGFQGGVVLATVPLLVYLCSSPSVFNRVAPRKLVELAEASGAFLYVAIGLFGLVVGAEFLRNVVPLGPSGKVLGGGTIPLLNAGTGLEVAGGFVLLMLAFLDEALRHRNKQDA